MPVWSAEDIALVIWRKAETREAENKAESLLRCTEHANAGCAVPGRTGGQ